MTSTVNNSTKTLFSRLFKAYITPQKKTLIIALLCMIIVAGATAATMGVIQIVVDELLIEQNKALFYTVPAIIIALFTIKGTASYFQNFLMEKVGQRLVAEAQKDLFNHLIVHDLSFMQKHTLASLNSRFIHDLAVMRLSITTVITGLVRDIPMIIGLIAVMFYQSWELALICLTVIPLAAAPIVRFGQRIRKYSVGSQEKVGELNSAVKESLSHIRQVKIYGTESFEKGRCENSVEKLFNISLKVARVNALSSPIMELLGGLIIAAVIMYGVNLIWDGHMTAGAFMAFLTSAMTIYRPLKSVTAINNRLQTGLAAAERTFEIMDEKPEIKDHVATKELAVTKGEITFNNISLTYGDDIPAVPNLSLTIPAGKTVALVGASGAGKSTILNMIPRFYQPQSGDILIDGQNINDVKLHSLRENIGLVTQDVAIFNDTVANNIAYGSPNATEENIIAAAKAASAHEFIEALEHGYNTILGEDGSNLSGGQKQRISIARAMLKNAPILLLDEATSSLDTESEKNVQTALDELTKNRTTLVVAHRLSTIVNSDIIYVLDKGDVVEQGNHEELISKDGIYAKLHKMQQFEA